MIHTKHCIQDYPPPDDEYPAYSKHADDIVKNKPQKGASRWFYYTGCLQMNGAVSKVNKKFISHLTRAPLAAATVPVSYVLTF